jgi:hypothetical protein
MNRGGRLRFTTPLEAAAVIGTDQFFATAASRKLLGRAPIRGRGQGPNRNSGRRQAASAGATVQKSADAAGKGENKSSLAGGRRFPSSGPVAHAEADGF